MQPSRTTAEAFLQRIWRQRGCAALLLPFALLFLLLSGARRALYRFGIFRSRRLPVPVVVIGNISVGGAGKTPLILYLAQRMVAMGHRPGIVSRGYGARGTWVREILGDSTVEDAGDEALLLKRRSGVPVFVGRDRAAAACAMLAAHPDCGVVLCDDGLQHYALQRDMEIAVVDRRGFMNGWLLPAGPLREPVSRLGEVDACVLNEASVGLRFDLPMFRMRLSGGRFTLLGEVDTHCEAAALHELRLAAFAGIGEPQRFFDHLSRLGLKFEPYAYADHHCYRAEDFAIQADAILTTEKDAVKCAGLTQIPIWVLPVDAVLEPDLAQFVMDKLENIDGPPPA